MNNNLNTIYLIDWDDTLFPTSWFKKNNISLYNKSSVDNYKLYFMELDNTIEKILYKLNKNGKIYIVTNANLKWINDCLNELPFTKDIIDANQIKILSARDLYSKKYLNIMEWKKNTFKNIVNSIINYDKCTNIISIGDADYEYYGLLELDNHIKTLNNNHCYLLKNIKFIESPNFEQIIDQNELLHKSIDNITNNLRYIDIKLLKI
jgi:hypothetical protein